MAAKKPNVPVRKTVVAGKERLQQQLPVVKHLWGAGAWQ